MLPIDLLLMYERGIITVNLLEKKAAREEIITEWQTRWDEEQKKGQWTKVLIPNITLRLRYPHHQLDYFITQVLSGPGRFGDYALKMGKRTEDRCKYCGDRDSVECPR